MAQDAPLSQKDLVEKAIRIAEEKTTPEMRLEEKEEILEAAMISLLGKAVMVPYFGRVGKLAAGRNDKSDLPYFMHEEPRLPQMPAKPTLLDYFKRRVMVRDGGANHLLQSANLARRNGLSEKIVLACLLHDISVYLYLRTDHGYHGAQLIEPYVDEEVAFAVRYHQALRFYPDESVGYEYPEMYVRAFGADYKPQPYIQRDYEFARAHKWYMSARLVTANDLYAFDPNVVVDIDEFTDIIGRNFKQPEEGLGFDSSPTSHMWRSIIWPNNYL
ncbi:MAG: hypothetical protein RLZ98_3685 [Pseudomonadota bacterium]